jgi:organic radical activating enzyme
MNKYFPIKTSTACQLKWTWSTIHLYTGETNSCHRVMNTSIDVDTFDQFHNTPKKLADRQLMLDGEWPTGGCEYCGNIERAGGKSDRQFQLEIPNLTPPELDLDPAAIEVTPRIVEVYLDNVCNMSCIYCEDRHSSRIQQENLQHGNFKHGNFEIRNTAAKVDNFDLLSQKFWQWMDRNYSTLRRLHVLGGEPFYQAQFESCLYFLETHTNGELEFNVVTNLKISFAKLKNFLDRIKLLLKQRKIKRFDITCSIDCWGDEQQYIRYGIDMTQWQTNFEYLVAQKWITLNINQTITGLGIKSMPALIEYLNTQRSSRKIGHYFMACTDKPHLNPGIFGAGFFDKEFEIVLALMLDDTWQHKNAKKMMQGLQLQFNTQLSNKKELNNLLIFLNENDRRRNLNWRQTFPWLCDILDEAHVV